MIDNGYLFAKDNKRIFINTSLGCAGQCAYCYLPKMGYSNGSDNYRTISAQTIIEFIEKNKLDINQKTLITDSHKFLRYPHIKRPLYLL